MIPPVSITAVPIRSRGFTWAYFRVLVDGSAVAKGPSPTWINEFSKINRTETTSLTKPKTTKTFTFEPVGFDLFAPGRLAPPAGTQVRKTQPVGCPRNGTMGHCYVEDATTGEFYGLVLLNSLEAATP